jgi:hypothetical protein
MADFLGREAKIRVIAGAGTPNTAVAHAFDADFAREPQLAVQNTYDTGAFVNRKVVRYDGDLTFKMLTDPADGGQNILRAAVGATPAYVTVDYGEEGFTTGKKVQRFLAAVRLKRGSPTEGRATTEVTLSPDGPVSEVTL